MLSDHTLLKTLLSQYSSYYLYDQAGIRAAVSRLQAAFPNVQLLYSVKSNPIGKILDTIFSTGVGADAASLWEVDAALSRGVPPDRIHYSAPGRPEDDLRKAYGRCILIADSLRDVAIITDEAARRGETATLGLRINPSFTFTTDQGISSKFGIDEEAFFATDFSSVHITGIHVHAKSQELKAENLLHYYQKMFDLADRVQHHLSTPLQFLNVGSGLGVPYRSQDLPLDVAALGSRFQSLLANFRFLHPETRICMETGRYLTCHNGIYVTRVLDKKVSRGQTYVLLNGTLNGFIRPAIAHMLQGQDAAPWEPLFTHEDAFRFLALTENTDTETITLCGNLCTAADTIAQSITLPRLEIGDGLVMTHAGSYAAVLTPMQFANLTPPAQMFLAADGSVSLC